MEHTIIIGIVLDEPNKTVYVDVDIDEKNYFLGKYPTANDAATFIIRWLADRNLVLAPDSARRFDRARRTNAVVLVVEAITQAEYDRREQSRAQAWHNVDVYPHAHVAATMM